MAKYNGTPFAAAAKAVNQFLSDADVSALGDDWGTTKAPGDTTVGARNLLAALDKRLGEKHEAHDGLKRIIALRPSMIRRFFALSVAPLRKAAPTTSKSPAQAAQDASRKAARSSKAAPVAPPAN